MNTLKPLKTRPRSLRSKVTFSLAATISCMLLFFGCNEMQNPVSEGSLLEISSIPVASVTGVSEEPVTIDDFEIAFNGSTYDADLNKTDFSYTVSRGSDGSGFNYMIFEVPACAELQGYTPDAGSSLTDAGIQWTSSIGANKSETYTISYTGEVLTGMVDATIQPTGSVDAVTKLIPGPCKGVYSISGTVYVDENGDGIKDPGEGGIDNVEIDFTGTSPVSSNPITGSVLTSLDGSYTFNVYTGDSAVNISIDINSAKNPFIFGLPDEGPNYTATTTLPLGVTIDGADVTTENVGFKPETVTLIDKFNNGFVNDLIELKTNTYPFWAEQFKFSTKGKGAVVSKEQLIGYLEAIDNLDLTYKFDFGATESERLATAESILTIKKKSTEVEILLAEFLAAMLNVVSGNGVFFDGATFDEFNTLILKTGAAAAVVATQSTSSSLMMNSTTFETTTFTGTSSFTSSGSLLSSFNGGGGTIESFNGGGGTIEG